MTATSTPREPTRWGLSVVLAWAFALLAIWASPPTPWTVDAFVPHEHRAPADRHLLWLTSDARAGAQFEPGAQTDALRAAALAISGEFGNAHVQLAPARADIDAWLDAHALYLLPASEHAPLGARLERDSMLREVQALHARLSSPLFGVAGEDARRDPLGIRELLTPFLRSADGGWPSGARPTPTGDLISGDGLQLVMEVRGLQPAAISEAAERVLKDLGADTPSTAGPASAAGPAGAAGRGAATISARVVAMAGVAAADAQSWGSRHGTAVFAAFLLGLIIARRDLVGAGLAGLCAVAALALAALAGAPWGLDMSSAPPFALAAGALALACTVSLAGTIICDARAPSGASLLALAFAAAPLLALPYPYLRGLAGPFALSIACTSALAGFVRARRPPPAAAEHPPTKGSGARRAAATALVAVGLGVTAYFVVRAPARAVGAVQDPERAAAFATAFFDPQLIIEVQHEGPTAAAALNAAARAHPALLEAVDALGNEGAGERPFARIDGPGAYLIAPNLLAHRRAGLSELKLSQRMQMLRDMLEGQGFRPEAFSEFLSGAADIEAAPDAQAALDGQLGQWISGRLDVQSVDPSDATTEPAVVRTRVHLARPALLPPLAVPGRPADPAGADAGATQAQILYLRGPAQHLAIDQEQAQSRLAIALATAAWVIALLAWLVHRQLGRALFVAAAACVGAGSGLAIAWWDGGAYDATALFPLCVVMGICAFEANEAMANPSAGSGGQGVFARTLGLVIGAAWMAAQPDPWVHRWGLVLLVGAGLGSGAAYFVARFGYGAPSPDSKTTGSETTGSKTTGPETKKESP